MTNTLALWLFALIVLCIGYDIIFASGDTLLFLARKGLDLIEWLAFWR